MANDPGVYVQGTSPTGSTAEGGHPLVSERSYTVAVILSGVFGVVGVHHFYIGRWFEGLLDFGMFVGTVALFIMGQPLWGIALGAIDSLHTLVVTIMLLTGTFRDGQGKLICYPGQKLPVKR